MSTMTSETPSGDDVAKIRARLVAVGLDRFEAQIAAGLIARGVPEDKAREVAANTMLG